MVFNEQGCLIEQKFRKRLISLIELSLSRHLPEAPSFSDDKLDDVVGSEQAEGGL